jgi:hypothetical protein
VEELCLFPPYYVRQVLSRRAFLNAPSQRVANAGVWFVRVPLSPCDFELNPIRIVFAKDQAPRLPEK